MCQVRRICPYYALDSINIEGNYDSGDLKGDTWTDDVESYQVMILTDNSVIFHDNPDSVSRDFLALGISPNV